MPTTHRLVLDVNKATPIVPQRVVVRQGEVGTQVIEADILNDGAPYTSPLSSVRLDIMHADGTWARVSAAKSGSKATCTLPSAALNSPGTCELAHFVFLSGTSKVETTEGFALVILPAVDTSDAQQQAEDYDDLLTGLYEKWSAYEREARANEQKRVDAEGERKSNETARAEAEKKRANAESSRAESEKKRAAAETSRADAEKKRAAAETERAGQFSTIKEESENATAKANTAASSASEAASAARNAASQASGAASSASSAATNAANAADAANQAASSANSAAGSASSAAKAADAAATSARGAASDATSAANYARNVANSLGQHAAGGEEVAGIREGLAELGSLVADLHGEFHHMGETIYAPSSKASVSGMTVTLADTCTYSNGIITLK